MVRIYNIQNFRGAPFDIQFFENDMAPPHGGISENIPNTSGNIAILRKMRKAVEGILMGIGLS